MSKNGAVQVSLEFLVESLTKGGEKRDVTVLWNSL